MCTCRYLSVAKNKRLRLLIVPREHLNEVGGYHSVEKMIGCNVFIKWLTIDSQQKTQVVDYSVVLCCNEYIAWHCCAIVHITALCINVLSFIA